jgi:hypothetical protein
LSRYIITVDTTGQQLNDGPVLTTPMGGPVIYQGDGAMEVACAAAKALVNGGDVKGAYVQLLKPVAFYMPTMAGLVDSEPDQNYGEN